VKRIHLPGHYSKSSKSLARGVPVNQAQSNSKTDEQIALVVVRREPVSQSGPRIEQCDFEELLERAMEILSARTKGASCFHP
jgi:hypothetical protein